MGRDENVAVFEDTALLCKNNKEINENTKITIENQKIIFDGDTLPDSKKDIYTEPAKIVVSKKRTFEAAQGYIGTKTAVLNFASATNPGGGVVRGASAQEECLCRCSNLYFCLATDDIWERFYTPHREMHYPMYNDDLIFSQDVMVFKTDTALPELMKREDWYKVDVITCAAPNVSAVLDKDILCAENLKRVHEKRLRRILDVAVLNGAETIILGAYGCGAFRNDPALVAEVAAKVLPEYLRAFKNIEYAVYCSPKNDRNYTEFEKALKN